jgi:hypothetical protein
MERVVDAEVELWAVADADDDTDGLLDASIEAVALHDMEELFELLVDALAERDAVLDVDGNCEGEGTLLPLGELLRVAVTAADIVNEGDPLARESEAEPLEVRLAATRVAVTDIERDTVLDRDADTDALPLLLTEAAPTDAARDELADSDTVRDAEAAPEPEGDCRDADTLPVPLTERLAAALNDSELLTLPLPDSEELELAREA